MPGALILQKLPIQTLKFWFIGTFISWVLKILRKKCRKCIWWKYAKNSKNAWISNKYEEIPHLDNTWPSCMCVIQKFESILWVQIYTMSPSLYRESKSIIAWVLVNSKVSKITDTKPWVQFYAMSPSLYPESKGQQ